MRTRLDAFKEELRMDYSQHFPNIVSQFDLRAYSAPSYLFNVEKTNDLTKIRERIAERKASICLVLRHRVLRYV